MAGKACILRNNLQLSTLRNTPMSDFHARSDGFAQSLNVMIGFRIRLLRKNTIYRVLQMFVDQRLSLNACMARKACILRNNLQLSILRNTPMSDLLAWSDLYGLSAFKPDAKPSTKLMPCPI